MELSEAEKAGFTFQIKRKLDTAFIAATKDSGGELSYAGVCQLTGMLEDEFLTRTGGIPEGIAGACLMARACRNPDKANQRQQLRKGLALMLAAAGGLSMIWSILGGLNVWTILGVLLAIHIPLLGPVAFFAASGALMVAINAHISSDCPEAQSARAHTLLLGAIASWADTKAASERDLAIIQIISQQKVEQKTGPGKALLNMVTWPYRSTADFVDRNDTVKQVDQTKSSDVK